MTDEQTPADAVDDFDAAFADDEPVVIPSSQRPHRVVAWTTEGPVTQEDFDDHIAEHGRTTVAQPQPHEIGPVSEPGAVTVATDASALPDDVRTVPQVEAWIDEGAGQSDDEAIRRAGIVWANEATRDEGVRAGVEAAVDRWLDTDTPS